MLLTINFVRFFKKSKSQNMYSQTKKTPRQHFFPSATSLASKNIRETSYGNQYVLHQHFSDCLEFLFQSMHQHTSR